MNASFATTAAGTGAFDARPQSAYFCVDFVLAYGVGLRGTVRPSRIVASPVFYAHYYFFFWHAWHI